MRSMVEGAAAQPPSSTSAPSTTLRVVPLPIFDGEEL